MKQGYYKFGISFRRLRHWIGDEGFVIDTCVLIGSDFQIKDFEGEGLEGCFGVVGQYNCKVVYPGGYQINYSLMPSALAPRFNWP